jgi:hypothetical protein
MCARKTDKEIQMRAECSQDFEKPILPWWRTKWFLSTAAVMFVLHMAALALLFFDSGEHRGHLQAHNPIVSSEVTLEEKPSIPNRSVPQNRIAAAPSRKDKPMIYSWIDEKGVPRFSDRFPEDDQYDVQVSEASVYDNLGPSESSARELLSSHSTSRSTPVLIQGNQILVPVCLGYRDREVQTMLLLDTGATRTTIHRPVAHRLNLWETFRSQARVADGRTIASDIGALDYIIVGPYQFSNFDVLIIDFHGNAELSQGLLGMNFLRNVRYDIDFAHKTINWR